MLPGSACHSHARCKSRQAVFSADTDHSTQALTVTKSDRPSRTLHFAARVDMGAKALTYERMQGALEAMSMDPEQMDGRKREGPPGMFSGLVFWCCQDGHRCQGQISAHTQQHRQ